MSWQDKVAKEFNRSFNEPFMPSGFCKAKVFKSDYDGRILRIQLGDRDVEFDEEGNSIGSGTNVGEGTQWEIHRVKGEE